MRISGWSSDVCSSDLKLLAARHDSEGMRKLIGADTLAFVSINGLYRAMGLTGRNDAAPQYCDACFSGDYPIRLSDRNGRFRPLQLSLLAVTGLPRWRPAGLRAESLSSPAPVHRTRTRLKFSH